MRKIISETLTDPVLIHKVLTFVENGGTVPQAEDQFGVSHTNIYRWIERRKDAGYAWPDAEDILRWHEKARARAEQRKRANDVARRYRKRRIIHGGPLTIDSAKTVRKIRALQALGWSQPELAKRLGVSPARISHFASAMYSKVNVDTAARIDRVYRELSGQLPTGPMALRLRRHAAKIGWELPPQWRGVDIDQMLADQVTRAQRRIRALYSLGWRSQDIARRAGLDHWIVEHVSMAKVHSIKDRDFAAIDRVFRELCMTLPPDTAEHRRQATWCRKRGYAPPLAWDDIDDLAEEPHGLLGQRKPGRGRVDNEARAEALRDVAERHGSVFDAMEATGTTTRSGLWKWCDRHNLNDVYCAITGYPSTRKTTTTDKDDAA